MTSYMVPLANFEAAWCNSYSLTKVPHTCGFKGVTCNMDKFSVGVNDRLITRVMCISTSFFFVVYAKFPEEVHCGMGECQLHANPLWLRKKLAESIISHFD